MIKKIAFYTTGFAFNRLNRMKFYERIFPKSIKIFLITTNRYKGKEKEKYQQEYSGLKRTKIIKLDYDLSLPLKIRKFCKKEKIDRIFNLGFHTGGLLLLIATLGIKTEYILNVLTDIFNQHRLVETNNESLKEIITLGLMFPIVWCAKKVMYTDKMNSIQSPYFFLQPKNKMIHLAAPIDSNIFYPKNKNQARKKLSIPQNKKVVIMVGRVDYMKCSDILKEMIVKNKDILFILIGRMMDDDIKNLKVSNFVHYDKKSPRELSDYYNASDFSFCINRAGGGLGLSTGEAMACGVPVIISKEFRLPQTKGVYQTSIDFDESNKFLRVFFSLSKEKREELSKEVSDFALKNYSDVSWKERYIKAYLD